ncbi:hypothetical protein CHI10_05470 [Bacillus sp. 7894-2]|nr:hypothetical protein CHI10_05470 [Bacillus sp. 7894-2]
MQVLLSICKFYPTICRIKNPICKFTILFARIQILFAAFTIRFFPNKNRTSQRAGSIYWKMVCYLQVLLSICKLYPTICRIKNPICKFTILFARIQILFAAFTILFAEIQILFALFTIRFFSNKNRTSQRAGSINYFLL